MKSRAMIDQILALKQTGHSIRKISISLGVSRNTVRTHLRKKDNEQVASESSPEGPLIAQNGHISLAWQTNIDWKTICLKRKQGFTAQKLFADYEPKISYSRFCAHLRLALKEEVKIAPRLSHQPGERVYVDFCDGVPLTDHRTGVTRKTYLFTGILPQSSYTFAMFVFDQTLTTFIRCHEAMWAFFGGITPYVVIDNLRAGVKKAHRYDPETNPTYCHYGNHSGFAVLPARPYTPRDKAAVEAGIGALQRGFFQETKERTYYQLAELNEELWGYLGDFNSRVMKDHGVSRGQRFEAEKPHLLPLPDTAFELCIWRKSKVHPDCCIQVDKSFYSVPFRYVQQEVRVKVSARLIEIFNQETQRIACHLRQTKIGSVCIDDGHLPSHHQQENCFDLRKARARSKAVGPCTTELIDKLLTDSRPLRYLRRVQGIFRLLDSKAITSEVLEYASGQALTFARYQLSFIRHCALNYQATGGRLRAAAPQRQPDSIHLHGG